MVSFRTAQYLLPFCPPGPAQSLLITAAGEAAGTLIKHLPDDDTTRRVTVRRAAAANKHLGEADIRRLAEEAVTGNRLLAWSLVHERSEPDKVWLLAQYPPLRRLVDDADQLLAYAIHNTGTEQALRQIEAGYDSARAMNLLAAACDTGGDRLPAAAVLDSVKRLATSTEQDRHRIGKYLVRHGDDETLLRALRLLHWPQVRAEVLEQRREIGYALVLQRAVSCPEVARVAARLSAHGWVHGPDVAQRLLSAPGPARTDASSALLFTQHRALKLTTEARTMLTGCELPDLAVLHALRHPDVEVRAATIGRLRSSVLQSFYRLEADELRVLLDDGPVEHVLGEQVWTLVGSWLGRDTSAPGWLIDVLVERGDPMLLFGYQGGVRILRCSRHR